MIYNKSNIAKALCIWKGKKVGQEQHGIPPASETKSASQLCTDTDEGMKKG